MKWLMLAAFISLGAGCGGGDGSYDSTDGDVSGDAGASLDDDAGRDVAPLEVGVGVSCADPDRPGEVRARPCASACGEGTERCIDGRWQACSARQPTPEDCHTALDDDCDGVANEDCGECAPGATRRCPAAPPDIGACRGGTQACGADRMWGRCEGEQRPAEEQCNGADDDCDGRADEDLLRGCDGACGRGVQRCAAGGWGACEGRAPQPESCNGVDDDCDGAADEDLVRSCASACGAGVQRCAAGGWGACSARQPEPEVCNGVDDDCDGLRDESLSRGCASACGSGSQACSNGSWGACSARQPSPEVCDLRDNNCDGRIDEGLVASLSFVNSCRASRVFVTFGGCNACRSTCLGYWLNPGASYVYPAPQNTCFLMSAFARTRFGDDCLTNRGAVYEGEVHRVCNGDCLPGSESFVCNRE